MNETVEDYVCHMQVPPTSFPVEYGGCCYAFCSEQCRQRFLENPHVYVGFPGRKAPGEEGAQIVKRRRFLLSEPLDAAQVEHVKEALLGMMGIQEVCIEGEQMEIQYDLMQATAEQIADRLALAGASLGGGWVDRLKLGFINFEEENEIGHLEIDNKMHYYDLTKRG